MLFSRKLYAPSLPAQPKARYWIVVWRFFELSYAHTYALVKRQLWSGTVVVALYVKCVSNCEAGALPVKKFRNE